MAGKRKLEIILAGDAKGLERAMGTAGRSSKRFGDTFKGVAGGVMAGVAGAFAVDRFLTFGGEMLSLGTQLAVFDTKVGTVFGGQADSVRDWADANNDAFGMSDEALAGLAAGFGDLLVPMGFTRREAAEMSTDVVGLSGALSAWSGGTRSAAEVSSILAKAILGERDSLKELGISITDADVKARLAAKGQDKLTGAALEQATAVATQELIMEKSADAQKAWADGSMDTIKTQNKLKAVVGDLKASLAEKLLPIVDKAAVWLSENLPGALEKAGRFFDEHLKEPLKTVGKVIATFVKNIGEKGLGGALKALPTPVKVIAAAVAALGVAIWAATAPISLIVTALAAVGIAIYAAYKRFPAFRAAVQAVVDYVREHWPKVKEIIGAVMTAVRKVIVKAVEIIQALWRRFGDTILSHLRATWTNVKHLIEGALNIVRGIIKTVTSLIRGDWSAAWNGIKQAFAGVWQAIRAIVGQAIQQVKYVLRLAWDAIRDRVTRVWDGIKSAVGNAIGSVASTIGDVLTVIKTAWNTVWQGMKDTVVGIWDGIKAIVAGGINTVLGAINAIIRAWNRLSFHTPDISILGFSAPSFDWDSPNIDEIPSVGRGRAGRSGSGTTVNVVINAGLGTDQRELRRTVAKALIEYASANGGIPLKIRSA